MSNNEPLFQQGDQVYYTGSKFKQQLYTKEGKPMKGWIHARVVNNPRAYVVYFPEAKNDEQDYVMPVSVLSKWRPAKMEKHDGPEIQPRRRRVPEEET